MKYLFKRVEINRRTAPEIWIVNNCPNKTKDQKEKEKNSYQRFFKNKEKVHYTNLTFEKFCEKGID
jgi:hypothetical protein